MVDIATALMNQNLPINTVDDLVANKSFQKWILAKDSHEAIFWNQWLAENPDKIEWVAMAKAMVALLNANTHHLSNEEINEQAAIIQQRLLAEPEASFLNEQEIEYEIPVKPLPFVKKYRWAIAASLLLAVSVSFWMANKTNLFNGPAPYEAFVQRSNKGVEYDNNTDSAQIILLSDGSEVTLEKNSRLVYTAAPGSNKREVFLSGNAFFKVTRNPAQPFIVYTEKIVTKVLGTSFWVKARPNDKTTQVVVRTGKVSVFKKEKFTANEAKPGVLEGLVLTPNQEVSYQLQEEHITKSLVPAPLVAIPQTPVFDFEATSAVTVFKKLQEAYGIPMVFDEDVLATCSITASFGNEPFFDKLKIICKIINASYEVIDGNIIINSKGCGK